MTARGDSLGCSRNPGSNYYAGLTHQSMIDLGADDAAKVSVFHSLWVGNLSNRNSADIVLAHQFCQFGDRSSRANPPLSGVRPTATDTANKNAWSKLPAASSAAYR